MSASRFLPSNRIMDRHRTAVARLSQHPEFAHSAMLPVRTGVSLRALFHPCFLPVRPPICCGKVGSIKTPTHMILALACSRLLPDSDQRRTFWMIAGAAAPDLPLIAVASLCWFVSGLPILAADNAGRFVRMVDSFYFESWAFIAVHHVFHAPGSLLLLALIGFVVARIVGRRVSAWFWFLSGAATHAVVDLATHAGDGMLLFWPFNWSYRFDAGIDQWEMQGAGLAVLAVELTIVLIFSGSVVWFRLLPFHSFLTMRLLEPSAKQG